jgi:hypothetical protein
MTGHLGASAPLPLWWQGSAAAKPLYHCLHDTDFNILENRSISQSLLALSTGGTCTFSAVTAAAAHHPQLDRAQMASKSLKQVQLQGPHSTNTALEITHASTGQGHPLPLSILPSNQQVHCLT